jgi:hypothetical protein
LVDIFKVTDTKARTWSISSAPIWNEFIDSCYAVGISGNENERKEGWRAKDGVKEKFLDWMITENVREKAVDDSYDPVTRNYFRYNILKSNDDSIITAYDQTIQRRLIVDGIHRAAALTMECEDNPDAKILPIKIFECYGLNVNVIFPCDIPQLRHSK